MSDRRTAKSSRAARGTVACDNTTLHLLKANDFVADSIRNKVAEKGILMVNIVSTAGSGKTTLMQETVKALKDKYKMAILVGDLETERDADRIREVGGNALQIVTGGICHLEAQMVWQAMESMDLEDVDILFVENVGNLVCPASFDLGEDCRVTLISTTEGDDKPKKYPKMILTSDLLVVSKSDLLPYLPFSVEAVEKDAREVNPDIDVLPLSCIKEEGLDSWFNWIDSKVHEKRSVALTE
jgi:hydrogenase nickel incorporation protein HypB